MDVNYNPAASNLNTHYSLLTTHRILKLTICKNFKTHNQFFKIILRPYF
jgi:hypothetical protein